MSIKNALLLGLFDGVHQGHVSTIEALKASGAENKIVFTFCSLAVDTKGERKLLMTDKEKEEILLAKGATRVIFEDFSALRGLSPEAFVEEILIKKYSAELLICGEDFRFGKMASGNAETLKELAEKNGIACQIVPILKVDQTAVSTTEIRKHLLSGEIEKANELLGYNYNFSGEVVHGKALGREFGIRTLNVSTPSEKLIPKNGVYSSHTIINGEKFKSITNIGINPTVSDSGKISLETHIIDFNKEIYGNTVCIILNKYYREERKFDSISELTQTISQDIQKRREEAE